MLITIDIGNTHICLGVFKQEQLIQEYRISTNRHATSDEMGLMLSGLVRNVDVVDGWTGVIIASVVPELDSVMVHAARSAFQAPVKMITTATPLDIINAYRPPEMVGMDRLVNAVGAVHFYGAPVIIVDFGTATTVDVVTDAKEYVGGAILPGLSLSADVLARKTSLLHRIELKPGGGQALGRTTEESLRSGIILGAAGAVSFLIQKMNKELGMQAKIVATGGMASLVAPHCIEIKTVHPGLTLEGLRLIWNTIQ